MHNFAKSFFAIVALLIAASMSAQASTVITFGPPPGPGSDTDFTSYTQPGTDFVVTNGCLAPDPSCTSQFVLNPNQVTAPPDTPPSLTGGEGTVDTSLGGDADDSVTVTRSGGEAFSLVSFDLDPGSTSATYTFTGYNSVGGVVYSFNGTDSTPGETTIDDPDSLTNVSSVVINLDNTSGVYYLDDVVVLSPEPSSLLLLGTGLFGLGLVARRRFAF